MTTGLIMNKLKTLFTFIVLVSLFVGCNSSSETETILPTSEPPTSIALPSVPNTSLPPTPTSLPLISDDSPKIALSVYVQQNGGCRLPCLLGLSPGLSDRSAVDAFVNYFERNAIETENRIDSVDIYTYTSNERGGVRIIFWEQYTSLYIGLGYMLEDNQIKIISFFAQALLYKDDEDNSAEKSFGNPYFSKLLSDFTLQKILTTYGEPSQILIRPYPNIPGYPSPPAQYIFNFALYYPELGFLIDYIVIREEQSEYYMGCPTQPYLLELVSWDPDDLLSVNEVAFYITNGEGMSAEYVGGFRPIEEVTSISITEFYSEFSNPDSKECVQSLKALWPENEP